MKVKVGRGRKGAGKGEVRFWRYCGGRGGSWSWTEAEGAPTSEGDAKSGDREILEEGRGVGIGLRECEGEAERGATAEVVRLKAGSTQRFKERNERKKMTTIIKNVGGNEKRENGKRKGG